MDEILGCGVPLPHDHHLEGKDVGLGDLPRMGLRHCAGTRKSVVNDSGGREDGLGEAGGGGDRRRMSLLVGCSSVLRIATSASGTFLTAQSSSSSSLWQMFSRGMIKGLVAVVILLVVHWSVVHAPGFFLSRANAVGRRCHFSRDIDGPDSSAAPVGNSFGRGSITAMDGAEADAQQRQVGGAGGVGGVGGVQEGRWRDQRFAMVTCSDGSSTIPERSFEGLAEMIAPNKERYVRRHGYDYIDASDILDRRRPPSWSKILAVQKHLGHYDWVFWTDADSVVTNPDITLQQVIDSVIPFSSSSSSLFSSAASSPSPSSWDTSSSCARSSLGNATLSAPSPVSLPQPRSSVEEGWEEDGYDEFPDFIVTEDYNGVNAGMFFVRNSSWSARFLSTWWEQVQFIQPFGLCKSGDNDALKYLIATMDPDERRRHVLIPRMQCSFNSYLWPSSLRSVVRLITQRDAVWNGVFAQGDFMVHLAGLNNKKKYVHRVLKELENRGEGGGGSRAREMMRPWRRKLGFSVRRPA
ncbi:hypothetical protein CBR_g52629 [Chara braunii]|uniref:GT34-family glycosyltransferase n=1 Tax=Chara braunii TaxID=69332 RepID=A0A388MAR3_CHABU|nr:hypothetical protein CBR_g52629 [Chara braunii]|eukprot:GBG91593.1 hypothetical protein CBR_g52629 [Chara braunii]